ncbi:hypothetical protein MesoLjLb_52050 [Mesorhizobium sp. L-8-3]|nr:hypothetical protein MesoLjLb_52050 [Mesorhizobium sp. L-8-3]
MRRCSIPLVLGAAALALAGCETVAPLPLIPAFQPAQTVAQPVPNNPRPKARTAAAAKPRSGGGTTTARKATPSGSSTARNVATTGTAASPPAPDPYLIRALDESRGGGAGGW